MKTEFKTDFELTGLDIEPEFICGVDEAGRGPLMGNVVAACVILDRNNPIEGLNKAVYYDED